MQDFHLTITLKSVEKGKPYNKNVVLAIEASGQLIPATYDKGKWFSESGEELPNVLFWAPFPTDLYLDNHY